MDKADASLAKTMQLQLNRLEQARLAEEAEREKRARAREELRDQRETEARERLLALQVEEAEAKARRDTVINRLLSALLVIVTGGLGTQYYLGTRHPSPQEQVAPVIKSVGKETAEVERRVEKAERKIEVLKDIAQEQQVQISDSTEYITQKIDAAHPRAAGKVDRPESVRKAKTKADAIKKARHESKKELFEDSADPFEGID